MENTAGGKFRGKLLLTAILVAAFAGTFAYFGPSSVAAADEPLLGGRIASSSGEALAGIPVRAHRANSNVTVSVYTNSRGEYSFPAWSDLTPSSYTVAVELPDFEPVRREAVTLSAGKTEKLDFTLQPRQPSYSDARASEIVAALPGTDEQKFLLTQCSNCHSLQWALRVPRTKEEWAKIVLRMAGENSPSSLATGSSYFGNKMYRDTLVDYLASIRGPGSSDEIPFRLRPRPTSDASTRLVVTEYDVPRGGQYEPYMFRGDRRFVWPHDVIMNKQYAYYTDHYSSALGRLDRKTGEVKEFTYEQAPRQALAPGMERAGFMQRAGGTRDLYFDPDGNVILAGFRFDVTSEQFAPAPEAKDILGFTAAGDLWTLEEKTGTLKMRERKSGSEKTYQIPPVPSNAVMYDSWVDAKGRPIFLFWGQGKVGVFDPKTEQFASHPVPTPRSGPRRGHPDATGRSWYSLYWGGRLGMIDPDKGELKEFPLVPDSKSFGPPIAAPYTASVDDKNQIVWANDFNSNRLFRFDMKTERTTEYFMPLPYEIRDLTVETNAERPTVWIPSYRPPSKLVKVQLY